MHPAESELGWPIFVFSQHFMCWVLAFLGCDHFNLFPIRLGDLHTDQRELSGYMANNHHDMSHWGGYALTQGFFYPTEKAYMIVCPQVMVTTPGVFTFGQALIRDASMALFQNTWA